MVEFVMLLLHDEAKQNFELEHRRIEKKTTFTDDRMAPRPEP